MADKSLEFKFRAKFASAVRCLTDEQTDKFLAVASLDHLKKIIPDKFFNEDKRDLFPIASNLAVVNMANANDDAINTEIAVKIYKSLVDKYLNAEHKRKNHTIGHIINAGFSKFNLNYKEGIGSELISEEEAAKEVGPFNICYSAIIYKLVSPEIIDLVVDSNNPESENYLSVSSSWEIGFNEYSIVVSKSKYLSDAVEIVKFTDEKFAELDKSLRVNGGSGKLDGNYVFRLLDSEPIFLGAALTTNPAASVAGTVFETEKEENDNKEENATKNNVIPSSETNTVMTKISSVSDLTDENLKKIASASVVVDFLNSQIKEANDAYVAEKDSQAKLLAEVENQKKTAEANATEAKEKADKLEKELNELRAQFDAKAAEDKFNARMASFDADYALADEDRLILSSDLKDMSDDAFASYSKKMGILLKGKKKSALANQEVPANTSLASTDSAPSTAVVDEALKNSSKDAPVPNTNGSVSSDDLFSRFSNSFKVDENIAATRKNRNNK